MSARALSEAFAEGRLSPVEVYEALERRIDQWDATLNCFCYRDRASSQRMAEASAERWRSGTPLSALDGVPISIKDQLLTAAWPTLRGSLAVDPAGPWTEDAPCVARIREAGMVLLGKTTTSEFGWRGTTDSKLCGTTRNPWNPGMTPGGSSGGAAAAVAAGLGPLAIGTDGGGSVRIPAALCGVVGLKPSFGRIPAYPPSYMGSLAHVGVVSRTIEDAALLLKIVAAGDARDPDALPLPCEDFSLATDDCMPPLKIGFSANLGFVPYVADAVQCCCANALKIVGRRHQVVQVAKVFEDPLMAFFAHFATGAAHFFDNLSTTQFELLEEPLKAFVEQCRTVQLSDLMAAAKTRAAVSRQLEEFFSVYDVLATPTVATAAFPADLLLPQDASGEPWSMWAPFTYPFNLTGHPAISINCGFTPDGLPVGLQLVGRRHGDAALLQAASAIESSLGLSPSHPVEISLI